MTREKLENQSIGFWVRFLIEYIKSMRKFLLFMILCMEKKVLTNSKENIVYSLYVYVAVHWSFLMVIAEICYKKDSLKKSTAR